MIPDSSLGFDSYIDQMEQKMSIRKSQQSRGGGTKQAPRKKCYPLRKQMTMPKRLPSNHAEKIMLDDGAEKENDLISIDLSDAGDE